ncbi:UNVERIFIED_CONTAM: hypothetical protein Sradi_0497700 [Sesamum radiatum]|uniref:Uncharacterized protein n=1 Tax=Sesamum radiatum TaxID=300843 RepID=A0AAW2VKH7_SESRA
MLGAPPACRMLLFTDDDAPPSKTPSPTTLLDGPYDVGRPKFSSFRLFREGKDSLSLDSRTAAFRSNKGGGQKTRGRFFGKLRSGGKKVVDAGRGIYPSIFQPPQAQAQATVVRRG